MARRGRVIGLTLGLLVGFLLFTSRKSTGSHPRDLHGSNSLPSRHDASVKHELRPIIKEPPGKWDPVEDRFHDEKAVSGGNHGALQEQLDEIAKQAFDLPAEGMQRKTPKKEANRGQQGGNQAKDRGSGINPQAQVQQGGQQKAGSGAVPADLKQEVLKEFEYAYDPAEDLKVILTQAPMIIFSKTHCPHSRDAKRILLESHKIAPEPFVVELDKHPHGPELQGYLGQLTGRRTVPNVLVNGVSIGGGDEMRALEGAGTVASTLLRMLAGKITVDGKSA